jgi:hypothetical protein
MRAMDITGMFHGLQFTKSASEIVERAKKKATQIKAKIEERQQRIAALRKEYGIDDAALVQLLQQARNQARQEASMMSYSYTSNATVGASKGGQGGQIEEKLIGAGVVNNLLTENDFIESERKQVATLELIARNLKPIPRFSDGDGKELPPEEFTLSQEELKYLDF